MIIKISVDDASLQDMLIADLLVKYDLEKYATFFFPVMPTVVNEPKGRLSLSQYQMQEIANNFEIGSHTITHRLLTRIPIEDAQDEIVSSRNLLKQKYGQEIKQFSYPRGYANPDIQNIVRKAGYESARSTLVGYIHQSENPFFEQTSVHAGCDRKEYGGKKWFPYAKYMLEQAQKTPDSVFAVFAHGYELASYPDGLKQFEELLRELTV